MGPICDQCPALQKKVEEIHDALCSELTGRPGLIERVRILEHFRDTFRGWTKALIILTLTNVGTLGVAIMAHFMKG